MNVPTEQLTLSVTVEAARMLRAFTKARNSNMHNQADHALQIGIATLVSQAPAAFQAAYAHHLAETGRQALTDKDG